MLSPDFDEPTDDHYGSKERKLGLPTRLENHIDSS
jgi:hypothetical protein